MDKILRKMKRMGITRYHVTPAPNVTEDQIAEGLEKCLKSVKFARVPTEKDFKNKVIAKMNGRLK